VSAAIPRILVASVALGMACAFSSPSEPEAPLIRRIYQPIGRQIIAGDILIARGVLQKCLAWRGRILDVETVRENGPIRLLFAIDISPIGMWPADVRDSILRFYAEEEPHDPVPRVTVEVLSSADYGAAIGREAAISLLALYVGRCPSDPPGPPAWWSGDESDLDPPAT
jgi:hypothetical protein